MLLLKERVFKAKKDNLEIAKGVAHAKSNLKVSSYRKRLSEMQPGDERPSKKPKAPSASSTPVPGVKNKLGLSWATSGCQLSVMYSVQVSQVECKVCANQT